MNETIKMLAITLAIILSMMIMTKNARASVAGNITTIAGGGPINGESALDAAIYPQAVAADGSGNLFFSTNDNRVWKLSLSTGALSLVAGTGVGGYSGDGGLAVNADLNFPNGVAVDSSGNVYIADTSNSAVRKVSGGTITTLAGYGSGSYTGDGYPATDYALNNPHGVAVDSSGNVFIADTNNNRIREVDTSGAISTFAGNGAQGYSGDNAAATSAKLYSPTSAAVDSSGNVYIADFGNNRVRKVDTGGTITTVAGNGIGYYNGDGSPATSRELNGPYSLIFDSSNNLYITDPGNVRIRKLTPEGTLSTIARTGTGGYSGDGGAATSAMINNPCGITIDQEGNLFFADTSNNRVRRINPGGTITKVAGSGVKGYAGDEGPGGSTQLNGPRGLVVDTQGNLLFADIYSSVIREIYQAAVDHGAPSVSVGYGSTYNDLSGSYPALSGHSYIRIKLQDKGSGQNSSSVTLSTLNNAIYADAEESADGVLTHGSHRGPAILSIIISLRRQAAPLHSLSRRRIRRGTSAIPPFRCRSSRSRKALLFRRAISATWRRIRTRCRFWRRAAICGTWS